MSLKQLLEVASVQSNAMLFGQTLEEALTSEGLKVKVEQVEGVDAAKVSVDYATGQEVATLINNVLDMAGASGLKVEVFEGACQSCAYLVLKDDQVNLLESASLIEVAERPIDEDDDEDDEDHPTKSDSDVGEEEDDEELDKEDEEDDDTLKILNTEETFKLVSRLHGIACGNNKQDFHKFLADMDGVLTNYRNRSGFEGQPETASATDFLDFVLASLESDEVEEIARGRKTKGKIKKGRSGFLSAYMKIVGKASDDLAIAWDHLDISRMQELLSECGAKLLSQIEEIRIKQGLDKPRSEEEEGEVETDEKPESFEGANVVRK